ncbi:MAG: hypothetical protein JNJ80_17070 [Gemmatimonadetes bacterium]|nr:hypothetical protein [Gemmatimonadota bacterium]
MRATTDIDILIEQTRKNARAVLDALGTVGYGFAQEWSPDQILAKPVTIIGDDPAVDIFTVAWSVKYAGRSGSPSPWTSRAFPSRS